MKIGLILQVRSGSTRFPNKAFVDINGKSLLQRCIELMTRIQIKDLVKIVATTSLEEDDKIAFIARQNGIECYRGNTMDVLDRYWGAAKEFELEVTARLTGDNPFIDFEFLQFGLTSLTNIYDNRPHLISSRGTGLSQGLDIEVLNFSAINLAKDTHSNQHREHVTSGMYLNPAFQVQLVTGVQRFHDFPRLTIDYEEDLAPAEHFANSFDYDFRSVFNPKLR